MRIGYSPSTGQYFGKKSDGSVIPLRIGTSQSTGKRYYQDEDGSVQLLPDFGRKESAADAMPQQQAEAPAAPASAQTEAPRPQQILPLLTGCVLRVSAAWAVPEHRIWPVLRSCRRARKAGL